MMRRLAVLLAFACIAAWAAAPLHVSGQTTGASTDTPTPTATATPTATPSPTPTSTASGLPNATDLLARMEAAMARVKSYHATEDMTMNFLGVTATVHGTMDVSSKPSVLREVDTVKAKGKVSGTTKTTTEKDTTVIVGKRVATRTGKKAWKCQSLKSFTGSAGAVTASNPAAQAFENPVTVGSDTVNSISVWHVHADYSLDSSGTQSDTSSATGTASVELYISKANLRVIRIAETVNATDSGAAIQMSLTLTLSKYGEKVNVNLPAACSK